MLLATAKAGGETRHGSVSETLLTTLTIPACGKDSERSKGRCATKLPRIADGDTYSRSSELRGRPDGVFLHETGEPGGGVAT